MIALGRQLPSLRLAGRAQRLPASTAPRACTLGLLLLASPLPAPAQQDYRISGHIVNAESGTPLAGAEIAIVVVPEGARPLAPQPLPGRQRRGGRRLPTAAQSATTTEDGAFVFEHVAPGKYSLEGSRRGFITAAYQQHGNYSTAIVTGPGLDTENLTLRLSAGAVIGGTVADGSGDAVEQANVTLYREDDDGLGTIRTFRGSQTSDTGAYEFAHLPPGTYFVSAVGRVWYASAGTPGPRPAPEPAVNLDLVYPRAFYADATDSSSATPIPVRGGERFRTDLHLLAVPAVHLRYTEPAPNPANPRPFIRPPMLSQSVFGESDRTVTAFSTIVDGGNSEQQQALSISVAPGEYEVEVAGRTLSVNASGDVQLDPRTGAPSVELSGRLAPLAGGELPAPVFVSLQSAGGTGGQINAVSERDGTFHFSELRPGAWELQVSAAGRPLSLVQAAVSGAQLTGSLLRIGTQPVTLAATVTPATAIVAGLAVDAMGSSQLPSASTSTSPAVPPANQSTATETPAAAPPADTSRSTSSTASPAQSRPGSPASGVMIVLVPEHLADHALYRRDQSDSDGTFSLRDCAPGRYTALAIRDGWDLDWAQPAVIRRYLHAGQPVTVSSTPITRLPKPLVVQPR